MKKNDIEDLINNALEDFTLEEILEEFDISPIEAFMTLFNAGKVDEELLIDIYGNYVLN